MKRLVLSVTTFSAIAGFVLCAWFLPVSAAEKGGAKAETPLKLGEERIPEGEDATIKALVDLQVAIMKKGDPTKRGQHAKRHGCVTADFVIRDDIPKEYRLGIFKEAKSYKAKVRFSNGSQQDDKKPDIRGMAIMVLGMKGPRALENDRTEQQDFVLIDSEDFFAPDAKTVLELMKHMDAAKNPFSGLLAFAAKDGPTAKRIISSMKPPPASPLAVQYWSTVPFKLGDRAVKYMVKPAAENGPKEAKPLSEECLRAAMVEHLTKGKKSAVFELYIIPQTDPVKMPIEDPTVRWASDPVPVATIKIEPQTFDTPARMKDCEAASFDPWHALAEHRPLGGVNRARKAVYSASVKVRQP
jgi:hypothetical protein